MAETPRLRDRFPALSRLEQRVHGRRLAFVPQTSASDCGPACLTMVLRHLGYGARLDDVRDACGAGRDGVTALDLVKVARSFGLRGQGISLDIDDLRHLPPGAILHWEFRHFVVLERTTRRYVALLDPAFGRRRLSWQELRRKFTGVALIFEPGADFAPHAGDSGVVRRYARQILRHADVLPRILVISTLIQLWGLVLPLVTGALVDRVAPRADMALWGLLAVGAAFVTLCYVLSSFLRAHLVLQLQTRVDAHLTLSFLDHLVRLPYAYFQRRSSGDLMMRLNSNAAIREIVTSSALSGALDGVMVVAYLILLTIACPPLCGLALGLGTLRAAVFLATRRRIRELMSENLARQADSQSYQVELLAGIATLKAAGAEHRAAERWSGLYVDVLNAQLIRGRFDALVQSLNGGLTFLSPVVVLLAGARFVMAGELTLGSMLAASALAVGFLGPFATLLNTAARLQELGSYVERIDDVLAALPEQDATACAPSPRLTGAIAVEKVTLRYAPHSPSAVDEVSLEITPGEMVAIVGRSAAGKSSLAHLLLGLYRPSSGRILYDGVDLARLDVESVRRQLGVVVQTPYLFGASIRDNISLTDPSLPLEAVTHAAKLAQIHDEIAALPLGYDTLLVDGGHSLSGGQRQRIALARALAGDPAILLLDEATSNLDAVTESAIHDALGALGCTRIVIAHRLSTIRHADTILVLEAGRIVERGRHEDLVAHNGAYRELLGSQFEKLEATGGPLGFVRRSAS